MSEFKVTVEFVVESKEPWALSRASQFDKGLVNKDPDCFIKEIEAKKCPNIN